MLMQEHHVFFLPSLVTSFCLGENTDFFVYVFRITFARKQRRSKMDVEKTPSSTDSLEARYKELARKTAEAIAAEGPPSTDSNAELAIKPTLPKLPRYEPPPPTRPRMSEMICRMFFPTSGHLGFDTVKCSDELPPLDVVRQMILYETRLRLSDSIQELMDEYHLDESAVT